MDLIIRSLPFLLTGVLQTLKVTIIAVAIGCVLGLFGGMGRLSNSRFLRALATCYVDFVRGTPLLVQLFIVYFGLPQVIQEFKEFLEVSFALGPFSSTSHIPPFIAAVVACGINSGAYVSEIFRAGIQSIEKGQREAALSLGMTPKQAMRYVILPQAFRRVVPPLGNEFIAMLKDTSLLVCIGYAELTRQGQLIIGNTFRPFEIWFAVAFLYLIMTLSISRLVDFTERRLGVRGHHQS
ncbi:glutamine transport system permease protein GlnP [Thermacetogenium phaeum DSM 12270]|uniref:Glutamine transport system permease protein GlnP n=1 Tax=Thermacetogenium phaeum (strain ATCC BAA-254 / DSM 26808 / PB) TaxID=1089553 RepID=K4LHC8_THEPS|nr:amino acid ABC transporter permease [Thermacetogenium phaeum]AFV12401.1 glutamine transport system permease protein GlnP [Thermacetogenium phaeum DSM 12270]